MIGLCRAFAKLSAATGSERSTASATDQAESELLNRAAAQGIESLDGAFRPVSEAAKEIGMGEHFAHPTAMRVLAPPDDEKSSPARRKTSIMMRRSSYPKELQCRSRTMPPKPHTSTSRWFPIRSMCATSMACVCR